jgi:diguanylate cyclase (GGDEF)-like protein
MDAEPTTERDAFLLQLPKRMAAIEEVWARLHNSRWDPELLDALYERVREVSELSKQLSLFQLNESVFSLEVYLSSFIGTDIQPDKAQFDAIDGLVRALRTAVDTTESNEATLDEPHGSVTVFTLGSKGGVTADLAEALRNSDCDVQYFSDTETLLSQLEMRPPKVIVADSAMLKGMEPLSAELVRLRTHLSIHIPLIFVSGSSALQLRVDAIRAGGDGFFVAPMDVPAVAAQILDMADSQQRPYRVVVVEDDPTQADFAGSILRKAGMEVQQITEPVKVIDNLREFKPDLILMDIYMPEVNGIELTTVIRDYPEFVSVPIVFVSGEQNSDRQLDALSVGGDDFIAKPIRPKHLLGVVETRIRRARQLRRATGQPPKHDRVTGLFSRQHFLDSVAKRIDATASGKLSAVLVVRPDGLDHLQESIGVGGVDHLLAELGTLLDEQVADTDLAARVDDRSFAILVERPSPEAVDKLAQQILSSIASYRFAEGIDIMASIGVCFLDDRSADATGIVNRASSACNQAAEHGGNRVHTHSAEQDSREFEARGDADFGQRVREALRNDSFVIQYQPLLDLQNRGSETYEIVLRVPSAQGDLVGGRELLEAAEAVGVCAELDQWILDRAIDILKQRRESGRRTLIFVHQSTHSALNPDLPAWLAGRLRSKQVVGTGLVVDFRLPDLSHDLKLAQANIAALRDMDVEVSLSRFPEKEAAFKVLRYLQTQYINIAPRLLKADRETISRVIREAHQADARVIVSNVDDPRSIDLHWSSGADYLQGNFIQRPLENMDYDFSQVVI